MKNSIGEWIGCGAGAVLTAVQTQELFQIISLILTCVATLVTISFNIYKWYKKAKEDGHVDSKEIEELGEIITDSKDKIESLKEEVSEKSEGE